MPLFRADGNPDGNDGSQRLLITTISDQPGGSGAPAQRHARSTDQKVPNGLTHRAGAVLVAPGNGKTLAEWLMPVVGTARQTRTSSAGAPAVMAD